METQVLNSPFNREFLWPRPIQLAMAAPSFLLWTLLSSFALLWYAGLAISAMLGRLGDTDWRLPYLIVMLLVVLVSSGAIAKTLWLAYRGRSHLWWHACSFGLGIVLLGLIAIVGD
jgi:hypothetical protein